MWGRHGPGTHNYSYWNDDLKHTLPLLMRTFAHPSRRTPFTFTSIEPTYEVYGWRVEIKREALEFSTLRGVSAERFTLQGSGSATITTAALYEPGHNYLIRSEGSIRSIKADAAGRLKIPVDLGPSNPYQQRFAPDGESPGTDVFTTSVAISNR